MIKVKLSDLVSSVEQLKAIQEVKIPIKISYRIKRLIDKVESILKVYNDSRNELVKEFGDIDEKTKNISVTDPEKLKEFAIKLQELLNEEDEIDFDKIKIEDLGNITIEAKNLPTFIFE